MIARLLLLVAYPTLKRELGGRAARDIHGRTIRALKPALARFETSHPPPRRGFYARALYQVLAGVTVLYLELCEQLSEQRAIEVTSKVIHRLITMAARASLPPIPARSSRPFDWFKARFIRANRPLTLLRYEIVEDGDRVLQANFSACGIAEITADWGHPEVGQIFCSWDEPFFRHYDPRIRFSRTQTIARGDPLCDFRFEWREDE